jgi:hypothetical protein
MLKATDLRIGNWLEYNGCFGTVLGIHGPWPRKEERYSEKWLIDLSIRGILTDTIESMLPIPFTREWLLNWGFKDAGIIGRDYRKGDFRIWFEDGTVNLWHYDQYELQYVHQLQNLYSTLTKQELTNQT